MSWCPSPYFVARYTALAAHPNVDLEAVFTAARSTHQDWTLDEREWSFRYRILNQEATPVGYYRPNRSLRAAWPILRGGRQFTTVLPYADISAVVAMTVARAVGRPVFLFVASTESEGRGGSALAETAKRYMFRVATGILATGPLQERYVRRYAGPRQKVSVIGNPVDTAYLRSQAAELVCERARLRGQRGWDSSFVITYVGRLAQEKSIDVLIMAAGRAIERGVPAVLAIGGGGPMERELRDLAEREGVRTEFLGFLEGRELCELYAAGDVFVLPSRSEPWGLVVNEAMEFALPVVVSDRVGSRHLVTDGETGLVVREGDPDRLAEVLVRLAGDDGLRATLGAGGRARIEEETIDCWVEAVVAALT